MNFRKDFGRFGKYVIVIMQLRGVWVKFPSYREFWQKSLAKTEG
jgi:hypothetical protein